MRKCALTMARNSVGVVQAGHERRCRIGRHREDHDVVAAQARWCPCRNRARRPAAGDGAAHAADGRSARRIALREVAPAPARPASRSSPSRAISGRHACPPAASVSRITAPASRAEPAARVDVEGGQQQRPHQPLIDGAAEADHLADGLVALGPQQPRRAADSRARACRARAGCARKSTTACGHC